MKNQEAHCGGFTLNTIPAEEILRRIVYVLNNDEDGYQTWKEITSYGGTFASVLWERFGGKEQQGS